MHVIRLRTNLLLIPLICLLLTSCSTNFAFTNAPANSQAAPCTTNCALGSGVKGVKVFTEPESGEQVILSAITGAQKSIRLEIYLLTNRHIIDALEEAAHHGVDVRVMLEIHPYGKGGTSPIQTLDRLSAAGVKTRAASPDFSLTHEKGMVIDDATAYILTANFTLSALGGSKNAQNREYGIIDTHPEDVQAISAIFDADWNRTRPQFNNPNLVVSPLNSRFTFETLIKNAHTSLLIEAEEMQDKAVEQAIIDAVHRGVQIQIIAPPSRDESGDSNSPGLEIVMQGGALAREDTHLYMHAKIIVVDHQLAFIGSVNISTASLDRNRELGILVADQDVLDTLQRTFEQDWAESQSMALMQFDKFTRR